MDGFLASRSFRRSGKQLDRKSSSLLTPSLTSTRRAKLSICHSSSPDSPLPSSRSIFAAGWFSPAPDESRAALGGLATRATPAVPRASRLSGSAVPWPREMYLGVPTPGRESPQPTARARSRSVSLASFSLVFYVSSRRYKGGFVMPPVCEDRGPRLTFGKTDWSAR